MKRRADTLPIVPGRWNNVKLLEFRLPQDATVHLAIQEYAARLPIYHFDAFRLRSDAEFLDLGAQEYFTSTGVCLIEWADRVQGCLPAERLGIELIVTGETGRTALLQATGECYESLLGALTTSPPLK